MDCYLVGGAVRDYLLGYPSTERDWVVVGATPEQMIAAGFTPVGRDFPVFLHPHTREEYALARTERKSGRGYGGFVCYSSPDVTLEQDLARRDLTINAMAQTQDGRLIDPYGGRRDLDARLLHHVSPAFSEDPLRILRVARFAARYDHLGFHVAEDTEALLRQMVDSGEVDHLVPERVWQELARALQEDAPVRFFEVLSDCGALPRLLPELRHCGPRTWAALRIAARHRLPLEVRFALLAAELGPAATEALCARLRAPGRERDLALLVARHAHALGQPSLAPGRLMTLLEQTDALRRPERLLAFCQACEILHPHSPEPARLRRALQLAQSIAARDLVDAGLQGPALGQALRERRLRLIEEQLT